MKDRKIYGISNVLEHEDGFYYVLAYTTQDKKADLVSTRVEEDGTQVYKSINSILLISWEKDTLDPVMSAPWCDSFLFSKKSDGEIVPNEKIYGISDIFKDPQGFNYICAYLDSNKTLENALLLISWLDETGEPLCMSDLEESVGDI